MQGLAQGAGHACIPQRHAQRLNAQRQVQQAAAAAAVWCSVTLSLLLGHADAVSLQQASGLGKADDRGHILRTCQVCKNAGRHLLNLPRATCGKVMDLKIYATTPCKVPLLKCLAQV
jgi:hypothetical protein